MWKGKNKNEKYLLFTFDKGVIAVMPLYFWQLYARGTVYFALKVKNKYENFPFYKGNFMLNNALLHVLTTKLSNYVII